MLRLSQSAPDAILALERHTEALTRHADALEALPAPDDELLTLAEAKRRTGVPLRVLRELPRQWGKVSMRDIQERIREEKEK